MFPSPTDGTAIAQEILKRKALQPQQPQMPEAPAPASPAPAAQPPAPAMTQLAAPSKVRGLGPLPGSPEGNNAAKLQTLQNSPSGIGAIAEHPGLGHHIAGHALQIADAIGSAFFPAIAAGIPGTQLHHNMLVHQAAGSVARDQQAAAAQDEQGYKQAQTAHTQAQTEAITNPPPVPDEYGPPIATDSGFVQPNKSKGEGRPVTVNGQPVKPAVKPPTTEFSLWMQQNPKGTAEDWLKLQAENRPTKEGEQPVGEEHAAALNKGFQDRWQVLHPGQPLPEHFMLKPGDTHQHMQDIDKVLESVERATGTKEQNAISNGLRQSMMAIAASNRQEKNDTTTRNAAYKAYQPSLDSAERFNVMAKNYEDAIKNHDQQAMLSLLANHLGMTMGLQKGARLTKDIIHEAEHSVPWLQGIRAKFDSNGYLSGVTLTPQQMRSMVDLGRERFKEDLTKSRNEANYLGANDEGPKRTPNPSTINHYIALANGDAAKAKQLAAKDGWSID